MAASPHAASSAVTASPGTQSVAQVPGETAPDATPARTLLAQTFTIESTVLGETRRINVYTPPGYEAADTRYPVLYMPDGGVEEDFPHVSATLEAGILAGQMRPVLLVGIENTERRRDMTGPTHVAEDRTIAPRVGGSAAFRAFIRDELMPEADRRLRGDGQTAIIGESLAGLFIVETFFTEPTLFDGYIALSPSLWWNNKALLRAAPAWLQAHPRLENRLLLTSANEPGIEAETAALAKALAEHAPQGVDWSHEPRPDLRHDTIYRSASPGLLRKLFAPEAASSAAPRAR
ncbi:alpha/beta hydrolase [Lysobacter psychrotolerans]|uniref:Alpha/beta hydrolase n=2 Tax=Montanilutibacter psychrotolerans TaxID=1327343 RepID=A0A3M8SXG2_9GAMM|nr:alpha/beta hydrolase [Lysobacter psychrotolerans]